MDPSQVHSYLNSFSNFEAQLHKLHLKNFSLNRIQKLLDLAGNPERKLKIVHIAGTKGKGSTCAFLAAILQEAGLRVGLYTSPHLQLVNERIRILNRENARAKVNFSGLISDEELAVVLTKIRPFVAAVQNEGDILTYFEVLTVAALCYFAQAQVDVVVLETGLGGRLDATNAADSTVAVITAVSMDHTQILGSTLREIATEKMGIIKNSHQRVVIAPQTQEVKDLILARCREFGIQPVFVVRENHADLKIGLVGKHQITNAATAVEVTKVLNTMGFKISDQAIRDGLIHVRWPGRFEVLQSSPDVIVDCAHNDASAQALAHTLKEVYPHQRVILILGVSQDKDVGAICKALKDSAVRIFLTRANHPRAHLFQDTEGKKYFGGIPFEITGSLPKALEKAFQVAGPQEVILVTGSIFLVAEAMEYLCTSTKV